MPPVKLGRYTLVGKLGAGAMAEVHAARLEGAGGFSRRVAIKRIRPHLVKHPGVHEMLVTEGRLAAVLEHASILQVYELLDEGGEFGLVMEYADAGSVQRLLDAARTTKKPVPWPIVAAIGAEVASALAYAHQLTDIRGASMGVVHRDVSPSNILLTTSGGVKLADFGIAAARGALARGFAGEVAGKADYMPKEQALGLPSDDRVDVFALGAVLYELLTLEKPFASGHRAAVEAGLPLRPLAALRPDAPAALCDAVGRALADLPQERPSAELLSVRLRKALEPVAGALAAGGLARYVAQHLPPIVPAPLEAPAGPPAPSEPPPSPRVATRVVGRGAEVAMLLERFAAGARAVALVGAPGMGKTTVAQHLVATHADRWPQRWFVSLQGAAPPWGLALAVSRALEVPLDTTVAPAAALERLGGVLVHRTSGQRALLVLDGAEAFGAPLRQVAPAWLERAPGLDLLLTSSERPGFGEAIALGPLPPDAARALLLERAPAAAGDTDDATLRRLVRRLDGVPLALELAAAALVDTPLAALEENLAAGASLAPAVGLHDALDTLVNRLDEAEQLAFAQLAIFAGGFTLPAATSVVKLPEGAPGLEVILDRLLQRSLVRRLPGAEERYGLYEVLRAWGLTRLDATHQRAASAARHASWFLREGARWAAGAGGRLARALGDTLLAELQNLLAVHQRALEALPMTSAEASAALVAALVLEPVLSVRGPHGLLLSLLDSSLAVAAAHPVPLPLLSRGYLARGSLLRELGRLADADGDLARGLALAAELGDPRLEATAHSYQAALFIEQARYELAAEALSRAEHLTGHRGDQRTAALCQGQRALLALEQGRLDDALALYREAMTQLGALGDRRLEALGSGHLGTLYLEQARTGDARACYELALSLLDGEGDVRALAQVSGYLAQVDAFEGHLDAAARGLTAAVRRLTEVGEVRFGALFEGCLGAVHARRGELTLAEQHLGAAEARLRAHGDEVFLEALAVHRRQLDVARGAPPPAPPPGVPRDNDVRLAWQLLTTAPAAR